MVSRLDSRTPVAIDSLDPVVWLDCRGRSSSSLYEEVHAVLARSVGRKGILFFIPHHLEQVEGPLSDFVLGLESILQTFPGPVVLGDPSGYATLVLRALRRDAGVRVYRPMGVAARPRRVLIVDALEATGKITGDVLDAFGHTVTLVSSGVDARRAVRALDFDFVVLDLDLPRMQSFGIAETLRDRRRVTMVGVTSSDELWARENLERYRFRRILSRPLPVMELLDEFAETRDG